MNGVLHRDIAALEPGACVASCPAQRPCNVKCVLLHHHPLPEHGLPCWPSMPSDEVAQGQAALRRSRAAAAAPDTTAAQMGAGAAARLPRLEKVVQGQVALWLARAAVALLQARREAARHLGIAGGRAVRHQLAPAGKPSSPLSAPAPRPHAERCAAVPPGGVTAMGGALVHYGQAAVQPVAGVAPRHGDRLQSCESRAMRTLVPQPADAPTSGACHLKQQPSVHGAACSNDCSCSAPLAWSTLGAACAEGHPLCQRGAQTRSAQGSSGLGSG